MSWRDGESSGLAALMNMEMSLAIYFGLSGPFKIVL